MTTKETVDAKEGGVGRPSLLRKFAFEWLALAVLLALGLLVDESRSWGWDESMHVGLPSTHMALALEVGEVREAVNVLLGCTQYPFVYPAFVAAAQVVSGNSNNPEVFGRRVGRWLWGLGLLGLALLTSEVTRKESALVRKLAVFFAFAFGLCSPLFMDYSATWFLEVPFATVAIFTVYTWIRRTRLAGESGSALRDIQVGALVTLAFFTKFNYGLLLGLGLSLDVVVSGVLAFRAGEGRTFAISTFRLAAPAALGFLWWFALPFPGGAEIAESHRSAFMEFLGGNQQLDRTPDAYRLLDWGISLFRTPRALLAALLGALLTLPLVRKAPRSLGTIWLVLLAIVIPIATHNFHLDRFLIAPGPFLFVLGSVGVAHLVARIARGHFAFIAAPAVLVILLAAPQLDSVLLFDATRGFVEVVPNGDVQQREATLAVREYQMGIVRERFDISPLRSLSTGGLDSKMAKELLDLVAIEVARMERDSGPGAKFGWLGISTELSPSALHIGLVARGGSPERLRRDAGVVRGDGNPALCLTFKGEDPGWNDEQLQLWANEFEVIFITSPSDFKSRGNRAFIHGYQDRLVGAGGWLPVELGSVSISVPLKVPSPVKLFALRRQG